MQRMKVVLPEPDGPRMHITWPGWTSSEMPFSTSSRPKLLWTASALTIGVMPPDAHERTRGRVMFSPEVLHRWLRPLAPRA